MKDIRKPARPYASFGPSTLTWGNANKTTAALSIGSRGALLANGDDVRVGFEQLTCRIRLRAAAGTDPRLLGRLITAGERFCVNLDTLRNGVHLDIAADV